MCERLRKTINQAENFRAGGKTGLSVQREIWGGKALKRERSKRSRGPGSVESCFQREGAPGLRGKEKKSKGTQENPSQSLGKRKTKKSRKRARKEGNNRTS